MDPPSTSVTTTTVSGSTGTITPITNSNLPSIIVLVLTGIFAVLGFGFIIAAILISENNLKKLNSNPGTTNSSTNRSLTGSSTNIQHLCSGPGTPPTGSIPSYTRISDKSLCMNPISLVPPPFPYIDHPVQKLYRTRALQDFVSTNHWISNTMYGQGQDLTFNLYPYYGTIQDDGFTFSWPGTGTVMQYQPQNIRNRLDPLDNSSNSDISYVVNSGPTIKVSSFDGDPVSCDIIDVDALVTNVIWQYRNISTGRVSSIMTPLAKGSPFITIEANNSSVSLSCDFNFTLELQSNLRVRPRPQRSIYIIKIDDTTGYALIVSKPINPTVTNGIISIHKFTGAFRLGYFSSLDILNILLSNYNIYPIESTIGVIVEGTGSNYEHPQQNSLNSNTIWNVDTMFEWTTKSISISDKTGSDLLMIALPHHNITNIIYESAPVYHPLIGPYRFVTTTNNRWILADAVANYPFTYPQRPLGGPDKLNADFQLAGLQTQDGLTDTTSSYQSLASVWETEISTLSMFPASETVNWCKWLGSLAILLLIGDMLVKDISPYLTILTNNLTLIRTKNGAISCHNSFVYDKTWGGIVSTLGLDNCMGDSDSGNAYYDSHIGHYGYLVFAYAVAGHFSPSFIEENANIALLFARDIVNPYQYDDSFPLWRNKDWYFGYSISSGLSADQLWGKSTFDVGESILGYYGCYLLSTVIGDQSELMRWSLAMLASEISSLQCYFQFASENKIDVDPSFAQGTITIRGDTYYEYTVDGGDQVFPQRNAAIIMPVIKPLSLISFDYINAAWTGVTQYWMKDAVQKANIEPESLAYALTLLTSDSSFNEKANIINRIIKEKNIYLPYGSTWSSILYWVLNQ